MTKRALNSDLTMILKRLVRKSDGLPDIFVICNHEESTQTAIIFIENPRDDTAKMLLMISRLRRFKRKTEIKLDNL